ncbi:MAG TPA: hypothetical protein VFX02_03880 [Gammaproteobacteria bacterium]|nr:hypothetical protein [Gammaproteobacteria bacterium]
MEIRRLRRLLRGAQHDTTDESELRAGPGPQPATATIGTAAVRGAPGFVRPVEEDDLTAIAELHSRLMPGQRQAVGGTLREQFSRLLLQHPWRNQYLRSLVYQESGGRIAGCIGVMPRPMVFEGRPVTAAISHSFMVEPGTRPMLAALALAQNFLNGPQDLSLAETGKVSRKLWERAGGSVSLLYSLCWTRPLKPSRYALSFLRRRGLPRPFEWGLKPACDLLDKLAPLAGRSLRPSSPATFAHAGLASELECDGYCATLAGAVRTRALYPRYDRQAAEWLLQTLAQKNGHGDFHRVLLRNSQRETVGWYLYCLEPGGGVGTVIQLGASDGCADMVFDHLCRHASDHGAIAVSGQLDPAFFHTLAARDCMFHHDGGASFLVHSRNPEILQAIHRGDAFLSRLEGEWWISFILS